jgi:2'-5' RNA ligase
MTSESALVVPVREAEPFLKDLRARFDPAAPAGMPAHVTVLYPFVEPETLDESTLEDLAAIFSGVTPFPFTLSNVSRFPEVVYLAPDPTDRFSRLTAAIATRWPEAPPYEGVFDDVVPHLTVAHTSDAMVIEEIRRSLEPALPIACTARQAWLMIGHDGGWSLQHRFPFAGTTA